MLRKYNIRVGEDVVVSFREKNKKWRLCGFKYERNEGYEGQGVEGAINKVTQYFEGTKRNNSWSKNLELNILPTSILDWFLAYEKSKPLTCHLLNWIYLVDCISIQT